MLDFSRLRSQIDGQRGAFEGLVRHLAQAHPPPNAIEFRHIHGAGGDGGIEAYWVLSDGTEHGYQAKFHTKSNEIDWEALDRSVSAAMQSHPQLAHIQVAVACDLTDVVPRRKGSSGRERWNTHSSKWIAEAAVLKRTVTFALWGASDIEQLLSQPVARGMREYWFGELALDQPWFHAQFDRTLAALEERYSPDDHVDIGVRRVFEGLRRGTAWREELRTHLTAILDAIPRRWHNDKSNELGPSLDSIAEDVGRLRAKAGDIELPPDLPFPTEEWLKLAREIHQSTLRWHDAAKTTYTAPAQKEKLEDVRRSERQMRDATHALAAFLKAPMNKADTIRFAIFEGRAGTGKSHLLAAEVARALSGSEPALMLLGTDFSNALPIDQQIRTRLGLKVAFDVFLGALSASAKTTGSRALIVIDAINEGGGAAQWRNELAALAAQVGKYPYLALVVSCRSEYAEYLLSSSARSRAVIVELHGFVTAREQEKAAQVYMDKRGILRPATPWLSPEFTNPLFLRTTCLALERERRNQYPTGLRGVRETLAFYLESTGRHLGTVYDGSDDLIAPVKGSVVALAGAMAVKRVDFVPRTEAHDLVNTAFRGFVAGDRSWLDRLRLRGIIRIDPHPEISGDDPMQPPPDVVRFAFQRFQDHLVAEQLLANCTLSTATFEPSGSLGFLIDSSGLAPRLAYEWSGVLEALWILTAEEQSRELVDLLPGGADHWWSDYQVQAAFVESVYWRSATAFTDRSRKLLNALHDHSFNKINIVVQLSVLDHPWNAEFLDHNLQALKLSRRDAFWTVTLNGLVGAEDEPSAPERLVNWCLGPAIKRATPKTLALALIALGWMFGTTNRSLRDRATKAATEILLLSDELLAPFVARFAHVDDLYVVERVLAACAGACLRDPTPSRLQQAGAAVHKEVFAAGKPPHHLLARDYARCIVELAADLDALPCEVDLQLCRPPYGASPPRFPKDEAAITARANAAGAEEILSSCTGWIGDFGRYVIESRMHDWSNVRLTRPAPRKPPSGGVRLDLKKKPRIEGAKLWVADRAIRFGWNEKLFPQDQSWGGDRLSSARIERIGKKYQWLAYFELLARLADNYWLIDKYGDAYSRAFDNPTDTGFARDIDPTVPPSDSGSNDAPLVIPPPLTIETVTPEEQKHWVMAPALAKERLRLGLCDDLTPQHEWISLYRSRSARIEWPRQDRVYRHLTRQEEFSYVIMIATPAKARANLVRRTKAMKIDFHDWLPPEYTDAGYLYELGRRKTWPTGRVRHREKWPEGEDFTFTGLTIGYHWESHLDGSLPNGASFQLPAAWLLTALDLHADLHRPGLFVDTRGKPTIVASREKGNSWCLARREPLLKLLARERLAPIWLGVGERSGYPDPAREAMTRTRWNGLMWLDKTTSQFENWSETYDVER